MSKEYRDQIKGKTIAVVEGDTVLSVDVLSSIGAVIEPETLMTLVDDQAFRWEVREVLEDYVTDPALEEKLAEWFSARMFDLRERLILAVVELTDKRNLDGDK